MSETTETRPSLEELESLLTTVSLNCECSHETCEDPLCGKHHITNDKTSNNPCDKTAEWMGVVVIESSNLKFPIYLCEECLSIWVNAGGISYWDKL